jgi:hypothetical protein
MLEIYPLGTVTSDNPYMRRFIGVEQQHVVFADREKRRYTHFIKAIFE